MFKESSFKNNDEQNGSSSGQTYIIKGLYQSNEEEELIFNEALINAYKECEFSKYQNEKLSISEEELEKAYKEFYI